MSEDFLGEWEAFLKEHWHLISLTVSIASLFVSLWAAMRG